MCILLSATWRMETDLQKYYPAFFFFFLIVPPCYCGGSKLSLKLWDALPHDIVDAENSYEIGEVSGREMHWVFLNS